VTTEGFGLVIEFTGPLQAVTTIKYNRFTYPRSFLIIRTHAKSSESTFTSRFLLTDLNTKDSSASVVTPLPAG
jgi:hypothetical protein